MELGFTKERLLMVIITASRMSIVQRRAARMGADGFVIHITPFGYNVGELG